jgi:hypothetical protein
VIKFVSDLRQGQWFSSGTPVSSINKTDSHDIAEILLKVALNATTLKPKKQTDHTLLQFQLHLSIPKTKVGLKEVHFRQFNLYELNTCLFQGQKSVSKRFSLDRLHCTFHYDTLYLDKI